jgi:hypothetical protein
VATGHAFKVDGGRVMPGVVVLVLVFGAWAMRSVAEQPAPVAQSYPATEAWRAVAIDGRTRSMLLLEPGAPEPVPVGSASPGYAFEPRDPSRLVIFAPETGSTTATVLMLKPLKALGPIRLDGNCGVPIIDSPTADRMFRRRIVQSRDGTRISLICGESLTSLDLQSGAVVTQPVPPSGSIHPLGDERIAVIGRNMRAQQWDVLVFDARTLAPMTRLRLDDHAAHVALVSGGREILAFEGSMMAPGGSQPSKLRYFDAVSGMPTRSVSLQGPFKSTRLSSNGRFIYATNMNRHMPRQTARELRILSVDTGETLEKIALMEHAEWRVVDDTDSMQIIEDRRYRNPASSRLVFLEDARVSATLPTHGFVHQLSIDHDRGRLYLLDGRSLAEYTWPGLQLQHQVTVGKIVEWGGQPEDRPWFALTPDATRALVVSGGSAVVVDLVADKALPIAKLGSARARARRFWGRIGLITLAMISRSVSGSRGPDLIAASGDVPVAFSPDARMAMLIAPTGELATVDMTGGHAIRNVPGGDAALPVPGASIAIGADSQSTWLVTVESGDVVARFPIPSALADARVFASISADHRFVLVGRGSTVHLVDATSGRAVSSWTGFARVEWLRFVSPPMASPVSAR